MADGKSIDLLNRAFQSDLGVFQALASVRSRRVGHGYRIDSGTSETHPVTGNVLVQEKGPLEFISEKEPVRLEEAEEALLCWAACGPNGIAAWDISMDGGFHELTWISGRTAPAPGNSHATDLLVINDDGAFIYKPTRERESNVEIQDASQASKVLEWYRKGMIQILDERPDIDYSLRAPGAPNATLMGPYQFNLNKPGSTWFIPLTDAGWLNSALINFFDFWHMYPTDEWNGGRPAGVEKWIGEGKLELATSIAGSEQLIFQVENYPTGCMVQNVRLAAESMGLGSWCFCGYNPDGRPARRRAGPRVPRRGAQPARARLDRADQDLRHRGGEGGHLRAVAPLPQWGGPGRPLVQREVWAGRRLPPRREQLHRQGIGALEARGGRAGREAPPQRAGGLGAASADRLY
jgi:hypothetical protein